MKILIVIGLFDKSNCLTLLECFFSYIITLQSRAVGNTELKDHLRFINRFMPILIYHFVRDLSTCFPSVCASPAKAPF